MRPLVARIDLAALKSNFDVARSFAPQSKNFAVIKADAYGHGSVECAKALDHADGFAVASVEEGIELRQASIQQPVLILSAFSQPQEVALLHHYQLMPVIHSPYQIDLVANNHKASIPINCWVKFDTGMNRLGIRADNISDALERVNKEKSLNAMAVMSHLACSDETKNEFTHRQTDVFERQVAALDLPVSLANSGGIVAWPRTRKYWNRPGIMLYGVSPVLAHTAQELNLKPVMSLESELISIKMLARGQGIGYGQSYVADRDIEVGLVACGYADGYPRHAPTGTPVVVAGQSSRILGRVSMDSLAVDLTGITDAAVGTTVVLWGEQLPVAQVADAAGTIAYELLTRITKRVPRVYSD